MGKKRYMRQFTDYKKINKERPPELEARYRSLQTYKNISGQVDIYQWGIFTTFTITQLLHSCQKLNIRVRKIFGFDSFIGLPKENKESLGQSSWNEGALSMLEWFDVNTVDEAIECAKRDIAPYLTDNNIEFIIIPGFFDDILTDSLVEKYDMRSAIFVDIDVDLYSSTISALNFMLSNNLILPGTIINYDDYGGTPGWQNMIDGQSRAHRELTAKYNVNCYPLVQMGASYPHVSQSFKIIE